MRKDGAIDGGSRKGSGVGTKFGSGHEETSGGTNFDIKLDRIRGGGNHVRGCHDRAENKGQEKMRN